MATKKQRTYRSSAKRATPDQQTARFKQIGQSSSQIVRDAALLLDDEMAAGIIAAKQMQQRFRKEQRINPGDFKDTLTKFQTDAHEIVNQLNQQFPAMSAPENTELVRRFSDNTHALIDLVVELVNTGAELVDQLAQKNLLRKQDGKNGRRRS